MTTHSLRALFLLDSDVAFLNHGSYGACPKSVFENYQHWQALLEKEPVEFLGRRFNTLMRDARLPLANYLHTDSNNVTYVINATIGVNIIARSLKLNPGDEILTTNHEYGAMDRTWRFLCEKANAQYRLQTIPLPCPSPDEFVELLWAGVNKKTRLIHISHITSATALIFPIEKICQRAREAGILTLIDGAHAIGQLPLALDALGADFYTSNCHKWLCAPKGSGFLYVRPELQAMIEPLVVSWGWRSETPGPSRFIDEQEWIGTRDPSAFFATPAAIQFQHEHHWDNVREQCHRLAVKSRERLNTLLNQAPICDENAFNQMFAITIPPCDTVKTQLRFFDEFKVEVPVYRWNNQPMLRVSVQGYNTEEDIDRLVEAVKKIFIFNEMTKT